MKRYFNTKEGAERHLEVRRQAAYKRIVKKGWKVVKDGSYVYEDFIWTKPKKLSNSELYSSTQTDKLKWFTFLAITTDELVKDLMNFKPIDAEAELTALLKTINDKETKNI